MIRSVSESATKRRDSPDTQPEDSRVSSDENLLERSVRWISVLVVAMTFGCAPAVHVRTALAPDVAFSRDRTFRFLPVPASRYTNPTTDPMLVNSITGREVQEDIARALKKRGYREERDTADLAIAYYIASHRRLDVRYYDFGYPFWGWRWYWGPAWGWWPDRQVVVYERGTVIIDILDGEGKRLLWRGMGVSDVPDDPGDYAAALRRTVGEIMREFPGRPTGEPWPRPVALQSQP